MDYPETNILVLIGDLFGCRQYRIKIPHQELKRFNVNTHEVAYLPTLPGANQFKLLVDEFSKYDMIIIQRCYIRELVNTCRGICDFLGIPLVFETDDDYLHIPMDNPAYLSMIPPNLLKEHMHDPHKLEELRQGGLQNYKEIIAMMDMVIVSTEELKRSLIMYNKNIEVLQNNLEHVYAYRNFDPEHLFVRDGEVRMHNNMGMITIPGYVDVAQNKDGSRNAQLEGKIAPTPRIGWSSTVTHWGQDFSSVMKGWEKVIEKYSQSCWFIYLGWEKFVQWHTEFAGYKLVKYIDENTHEGKLAWVPDDTRRQLPRRVLHIPDSFYDLYMFHLRNLDVGIAPLAPNVFNMSKSDIKAMEYAAWRVPAVLPRFQTYSRNWVDGKNCLMYSNVHEFSDAMDTIINDHELRIKLGNAAFEYVRDNRIESQHSERRYQIYRRTIEAKHRLRSFLPEPKAQEVPNVGS